MVTGVSAESGKQGKPVYDRGDVNFTSLWQRWGEHFTLSVQQTLDKPDAILRQSDKPQVDILPVSGVDRGFSQRNKTSGGALG